MNSIIYLLPLVALLLGFLFAWWLKGKQPSAEQQISQEKIAGLEQQVIRLQADLKTAEEERSASVSKALSNEQLLRHVNEQYEKLKNDYQAKDTDLGKLVRDLATAEADLKSTRELLNQLNTRIEDMNKKQEIAFENAANKILNQNSKNITELQQENLKKILDPFSKDLQEMKKQVNETYVTESKERHSLGQQVEKLFTLNQQLSTEASNLTKALKGDKKMQGDWGQVILENILDACGLTEGRDYYRQHHVTDEEGNNLYPDIVVNYPDARKVVVDSKLTLIAYERYMSAATPAEEQAALAELIANVRKHMNDLAKKDYAEHAEALENVLMFVPIEAAWLLAMKSDPELWRDAYKKKILIVSPTNLMAVLRIIGDMWKVEKQNQNALEIAQKAGALYDKFADVVKDFRAIGESLSAAKTHYTEGMKKLVDGRGNIIRKVESLQEMGAITKGTKSFPTDDELNKELGLDD